MTTQQQIWHWRYQELIQAARGDVVSLSAAAQAQARWQALAGEREWVHEYLRWPLPRYNRDEHMSGLSDKDIRKQRWIIEQKQKDALRECRELLAAHGVEMAEMEGVPG